MSYLPNQMFLSDECREVVEAAPPVARYVSPKKEPRQETIWLVATWYAPHGRWIIEKGGGYDSEAYANRRANQIVNTTNGHTEAVVVKLCLGPSVK